MTPDELPECDPAIEEITPAQIACAHEWWETFGEDRCCKCGIRLEDWTFFNEPQ